MTAVEFWQQFLFDLRHTTWPEYVAVVTGIASVYFQRIENIWVYPLGLINTILYVILSVNGHLFGEASVNLYYTIMSIYGWVLWSKKDTHDRYKLRVSFSSKREWTYQLIFFAVCYVLLYSALRYLKANFAPGAIPWADAFASATAYTGMWLMAKKKVESWYWWMATNVASIPLYAVKHYVFTGFYYLVLLVMAIFGLLEWMRRARNEKRETVSHLPSV